MIDVTYHKRYFQVDVTGHAGAGERGEDVVCAGVSALVTGLAVNVKHMADMGAFMDWKCDISDGDAHISILPKQRYRESCQNIMDAFCAAIEYFSGISDGYIRYTFMG